MNGSNPIIRNCIIRDNETTFDGGGLYARRGSPLIEDCVFEGNVASWYRGGAMYVIDSPGIVIRRTEFRGNYGDDGGGGILAKETDLVLEDCSFIGNVTTGPGGGVSVEGGTAKITTIQTGWRRWHRARQREALALLDSIGSRVTDFLTTRNEQVTLAESFVLPAMRDMRTDGFGPRLADRLH